VKSSLWMSLANHPKGRWGRDIAEMGERARAVEMEADVRLCGWRLIDAMQASRRVGGRRLIGMMETAVRSQDWGRGTPQAALVQDDR
jgi:hypothetical protein